MSADEPELEGEDEKSLREHFAPVWRSLKRTVTSRSIQAYAVSFVGVIVLSAGIGGAVIGSYATVQKDFGLCSDPILSVDTANASEEVLAGDDPPTFRELDDAELTPAERTAVRSALEKPTNEAEIDGDAEHLAAFRNGAVVTYRGEDHYVAITSMNECVRFDERSYPLSIVGVVVGAGLFVGPGLWRRLRRRLERDDR